MKTIVATSALIIAAGSSAFAGGLDRSGQGIGALFESGDYAELSYGLVMPNVSGVGLTPAFGAGGETGNVAPSYSQIGLSFKTDLSDTTSLAVIFDQPFGASVNYADPSYVLTGTSAEMTSSSVTLVGRYKINPSFSVHGGLRTLSASGNVAINDPLNGPGVDYAATFDAASGMGYVIGAAFEKPEIAMRVALTYSSAIDLSLPTTLTTPAAGAVPAMDATLPQSVNLDFQSGVAANTLVFGSIRWAEWTSTELNPFGFPANPLLSYDNDTFTYSLGVGRKFSDSFSGSVTLGYEKATGEPGSNLSPTDGYFSIQVGGAYTLENGMKISGGVRYVKVGDTITETVSGDFSGNSAIGVGVKIGYSF